jgi:hypothetical protein
MGSGKRRFYRRLQRGRNLPPIFKGVCLSADSIAMNRVLGDHLLKRIKRENHYIPDFGVLWAPPLVNVGAVMAVCISS